MKKRQATRTIRRLRKINRQLFIVERAIIITGIFWVALAFWNVYLIIDAEDKESVRIEACYAHYEAKGWDAYEAAGECEVQ